MENIVISAKIWNGFFVSYPMGSHLNFVANNTKSLSDGLKTIKWSYNPVVYEIQVYGAKPKFKKLGKKDIEAITMNFK